MKVYVLVEVWQLIVSGVLVSSDLEKAKARFTEYTGVNYDRFKADLEADEHLPTEDILGDFDQTKIFEVELEV